MLSRSVASRKNDRTRSGYVKPFHKGVKAVGKPKLPRWFDHSDITSKYQSVDDLIKLGLL